MAERLGRRVAAAEAGARGEDEFEFRRRAAGDERPDQGQRVLVEVGLEKGRKLFSSFVKDIQGIQDIQDIQGIQRIL